MISGLLSSDPVDGVQPSNLVLSHPPYHDMIPYSGSEWGRGVHPGSLSVRERGGVLGYEAVNTQGTHLDNHEKIGKANGLEPGPVSSWG